MLAPECTDSLPNVKDTDPVGLERIRFAVLKLSGGDINELRRWIDDAKRDWRDVLMDAGFGLDIHSHEMWEP